MQFFPFHIGIEPCVLIYLRVKKWIIILPILLGLPLMKWLPYGALNAVGPGGTPLIPQHSFALRLHLIQKKSNKIQRRSDSA